MSIPNTRIVSDSSRFDFEIYPRARNISPGISTIQESVSSHAAYKPLPTAPTYNSIQEIDHTEEYNDRAQLLQSNHSASRSIDLDEVAPILPPQSHARSKDVTIQDIQHMQSVPQYQTPHHQQGQREMYDDESIQLSLPKLRNRTLAPSVNSSDTDYFQIKQRYYHKASDSFTEVSDVPQNAIVDVYAQPSEYDPTPASQAKVSFSREASREASREHREQQREIVKEPSTRSLQGSEKPLPRQESGNHHFDPQLEHNNSEFEFKDYTGDGERTPSIQMSKQSMRQSTRELSNKSSLHGQSIQLKRGGTQKSVARSIIQGNPTKTKSLNGSINSFTSHNTAVDYLPPMQPRNFDRSMHSHTDPELISQTARRQELEQLLIHKVMARPLGRLPGMKKRNGEQISITLSFILHSMEVIFAIIVIGLSSAMIHLDPDIGKGIYIYILIEACTLLLISCLLLFNIMTFEHNNGIFYCLMCAILSVVAFGFSVGLLIPANTCHVNNSKLQLCSMRQAISAFIIISTFTWVTNCVTFLTVFYISKLDLLPEINWDYDDMGFQIENPRFKRNGNGPPLHVEQLDTYDNLDGHIAGGNGESYMNPNRYENMAMSPGEMLKEYILNENGSLYEVHDQRETMGKNKVIVYTV